MAFLCFFGCITYYGPSLIGGGGGGGGGSLLSREGEACLAVSLSIIFYMLILLGQGPAAETVCEKLVSLKRERKLDTFSLRLPVQAFLHTKSDLAYTIQLMCLAYSSAALHLHCFCHTFSAVDVEIFDLSHVASESVACGYSQKRWHAWAVKLQLSTDVLLI